MAEKTKTAKKTGCVLLFGMALGAAAASVCFYHHVTGRWVTRQTFRDAAARFCPCGKKTEETV